MEGSQGSKNAHVGQLDPYHAEGDHRHQSIQFSEEEEGLHKFLQPIKDASHTRDRKRSPPDSACMKGTRVKAVMNITTWAHSNVIAADEPHIRWMHGYAGSGKSAISQEVCDTSERQDRPVASFFFFHGVGDRSKIWRLATTLASQMATVISEMRRFILAAMKANPALLQSEEGRLSLRTRRKSDSDPLQHSVGAQMRRLLHGAVNPTAQREAPRVSALAKGPFLIVLDGLDECVNKEEVRELIDDMILFFEENPLIPLRVFITSRVEEHVQSRLNVPGVQLDNLVDHCSEHDIATFLQIMFEDACKQNRVIQAYVQQHGEWPTSSDKNELVQHIGGSFIFASVVFKFTMGSTGQSDIPTTPMDRFPLALKPDPGLDGLYTETLVRSEHLPHFLDIISIIALLQEPPPTSIIAGLLGISVDEVVNVLVSLQAIIQVPGTDDMPVTPFHTSLRNFLITENRSGRFCAHPRHHVRIFFGFLNYELRLRRRQRESSIHPVSGSRPAFVDALHRSLYHLNQGLQLFEVSELESAIQLRLEALELQPDDPELTHALANVTHIRVRSVQTASLADYDKIISLYRQVLDLRPSPHPDRQWSLNDLECALTDRYQLTGSMTDLEEGISLGRESLELLPPFHPRRPMAMYNLGHSLMNRYRRTSTMEDLEEAIPLLHEALEHLPSPHLKRWSALDHLGNALYRSRRAETMADLEEAIVLYHQALELVPSPHIDRWKSLDNLCDALLDRYEYTHTGADLEEFTSLSHEALDLRPSTHSNRFASLSNLGIMLLDRYHRTETMADLEEARFRLLEALKFLPAAHSNRSAPLHYLVLCFRALYKATGALTHLQEALTHCEELLNSYYPIGHDSRAWCRDTLADLLQMYCDATGELDVITRIEALRGESN